MPHEIVNGANGSVTWCGGPGLCRTCDSDRQSLAQRISQPLVRLGGGHYCACATAGGSACYHVGEIQLCAWHKAPAVQLAGCTS